MGVKDPREGTPIDEAVRRMGGPCNPHIAESLRLAAEAFHGDPNDVSEDIENTLSWMIEDLDARRDQGPNGLDPGPLSPQMQLAHDLLADLRAGKIVCRRIVP
jgi:hypothetical protein